MAEWVERLLPGLNRLWQAHEYGEDVQSDQWDFAVDLGELREAGLASADVRWLLHRGYVEHAREMTLPGDEGRVFRRTPGAAFTKKSCFVLTQRGVQFLRQLRESTTARQARVATTEQRVVVTRCATPHWDRDRQELRVSGMVIKQFKVPAPNQEMILAAFEEEGWPPRIDDPLPPHPQQDPKRRLHDTINSLNRNHRAAAIRFLGDGSGTGVRWEAARDSETPHPEA